MKNAMLSRDLEIHVYKIQLTQELKPADDGKRHRFARQAQKKNFTSRIFSLNHNKKIENRIPKISK